MTAIKLRMLLPSGGGARAWGAAGSSENVLFLQLGDELTGVGFTTLLRNLLI